MSRNALPAEVLDGIAAAGFSVYQSKNPAWRSYLFFTDGANIGYLQRGDWGGLSLSTVHVPNSRSGTGFRITDDGTPPVTLTRGCLVAAFSLAPHWASRMDIEATKKWPSLAAFLQSHKDLMCVRVMNRKLTQTETRKADWRSHPGLDSYIGTALEDFQNSDSNSEEGRDTGTIYTLTPETYERLKADYVAFTIAARHDFTQWREEYGAESFGSDFHLTRTGHGVGFWDRGAGELGERLTALCGYGTAFPPLDFHFGDDGEVYAS